MKLQNQRKQSGEESLHSKKQKLNGSTSLNSNNESLKDSGMIVNVLEEKNSQKQKPMATENVF